jgi:hypothetical protein
MPSLHFGYSLLIGLTLLSLPISTTSSKNTTFKFTLPPPSLLRRLTVRIPLLRRLILVILGIAYPATIFIAIVATANHFILDAVAGAVICGFAWWGNGWLVNLMAVEDWFLWCCRLHRPTVTESLFSRKIANPISNCK